MKYIRASKVYYRLHGILRSFFGDHADKNKIQLAIYKNSDIICLIYCDYNNSIVSDPEPYSLTGKRYYSWFRITYHYDLDFVTVKHCYRDIYGSIVFQETLYYDYNEFLCLSKMRELYNSQLYNYLERKYSDVYGFYHR